MQFVIKNKVLLVFAVGALLVSGSAAADSLEVKPEEHVDLTPRIEALEAKVQAASATAFNPSITVFGNVMGCFSRQGAAASDASSDAHGHAHDAHEKKEHDHHGHDHDHHGHDHDHDAHHHVHADADKKTADSHSHGCSNGIMLREIEVDLRSPIAPGVDGVVILAFGQESPGEFHAEVEEAYALLKPGFVQMRLGRILSSFGRINRIHTHDLPQMTRPDAALHFLGDHGFAHDGASAEFMIPTPGESNALTASAEVLFGNFASETLALAGKSPFPKFVGRMSWFFDLGKGHDLDIGASALLQPRENGPLFQLYGADVNYRWRPYILGAKRSFLLGAEMFAANNGAQTFFDSLPIGGFAWSQVQLNENAYLGVRYSYDQGVTEDNKLNTAAGVFLTYYATEFLRARVGYERASHDIGFKDGRDQFMIELNFIFGSHPAEPYWVNR